MEKVQNKLLLFKINGKVLKLCTNLLSNKLNTKSPEYVYNDRTIKKYICLKCFKIINNWDKAYATFLCRIL